MSLLDFFTTKKIKQETQEDISAQTTVEASEDISGIVVEAPDGTEATEKPDVAVAVVIAVNQEEAAEKEEQLDTPSEETTTQPEAAVVDVTAEMSQLNAELAAAKLELEEFKKVKEQIEAQRLEAVEQANKLALEKLESIKLETSDFVKSLSFASEKTVELSTALFELRDSEHAAVIKTALLSAQQELKTIKGSMCEELGADTVEDVPQTPEEKAVTEKFSRLQAKLKADKSVK